MATLPRRRSSAAASSSVQVTDGVLEPALLAQVAAELASAADAGQFTTSHEQPEHIRTDHILWLNTELAEQRGMPATAAAIEAFRDHIMASLGSRPGAQDLLLPRRFMLSCYDGADAHYTPHRDGFMPPTWRDAAECGVAVWGALRQDGAGSAARALALSAEQLRESQLHHRVWTAIIYLNNTPESAWDPEADGGALRCFVGAAPDDRLGDTAEEVLDVAPVGGRTVLFPSRDLLHAVTPRCLLPHHRHTHTCPRRRRLWRLRKAERVRIRHSRRRRLAMTAWIFDPQILSSEEMAQFVG